MDLNFSQLDIKQEASNREKIYFVLILLLIVVAFARWFYIPKIKEIKLLKIGITSNLMQIEQLKKFAQLSLPALQTTVAGDYQVRSGSKFEKAIEESSRPSQQVVADIVKMFTSQDILNGVSLSGMAFTTEVDKGGYGLVPVNIDLEGKYTGILNYLGHIEKFGKLIMIDNIDLTSKEGAPSVVRAKVSASIYVVHQGLPGGGASGGGQQPNGETKQ